MNKLVPLALGMVSIGLSAPGQAFDITPETMLSVDVIAASDYRVGGFSLTQGNPALMSAATLVHKPSGVFAGVFTSNVNFGTDTRREFDYYAGIARPLTEHTRFSLEYVAYDYPKDSWVNFNEWIGTVGYYGATLGVKYTNNLQNPPARAALAAELAPYGITIKPRDKERVVTWLEYTVPLPYQVLLNARYGYTETHDDLAYQSGNGSFRSTYRDWQVAISKPFLGFTWKAAYIDTDLSKAECYSAFGAAGDCSATVVASVIKSF